jgi:hypothetical protein
MSTQKQRTSISLIPGISLVLFVGGCTVTFAGMALVSFDNIAWDLFYTSIISGSALVAFLVWLVVRGRRKYNL